MRKGLRALRGGRRQDKKEYGGSFVRLTASGKEGRGEGDDDAFTYVETTNRGIEKVADAGR